MKSLLAIAAVAAILATAPAHAADYHSGNIWLSDCQSKQAASYLSCYVYARGAADGLSTTSAVLASLDHKNPYIACIPDAATTQQLVEIGVAYLRKHPEKRHELASLVLAVAWSDAWPCTPEPDTTKGQGRVS